MNTEPEKLQVDDFLTYIQRDEDRPYLRSKLLDVNMRLFGSSAVYRGIVRDCCKYIRSVALSKLEGYGWPYGMSGANLAIPFNIVGVVRNRGTSNAYCVVLLNPKVLEYLGSLRRTTSNCGSIRLKKPIEVLRHQEVRVSFFDEEGIPRIAHFTQATGSFTVQHEVDHNSGVLITDREAVQGVS